MNKIRGFKRRVYYSVYGRNKKEHDQKLRTLREIADKYWFTLNQEKSILGVEELRLLKYKVKKIMRFNQIRKEYNHKEISWTYATPLLVQIRIVGYFACYSKWIRNYSDKIVKLLKPNHYT